MPHHFESALGLFVCRRDLRLYLGGGLFHFWREAHVAVVLHAGSGRDKPADDDVLLKATQVIDRSLNGSFGEHARSLLEGRRRDERVGRERRFRDAEEQRASGSRLAALLDHAFVLFAEAELIQLLLQQERGVAHVLDLHPAHHLADNHFNVLVGDVDALQAVDFLDFVHQVRLQLFLAEYSQNVVRVERAVHQGFASFHALAFLHVNVDAARYGIFLLRAVIGCHIEFALSLGHFTEAHRAIDFADDSRFTRLASLEQFHHTRQTARDVLGLRRLARDLGQHVARIHRIAVLHHEVSARRHQIALARLALDDDRRLPLLVGRIRHDVTRETSDFVDFFVQGDTFLQVFELRRAANFREDSEGIRIPLDQCLAEGNWTAVRYFDLGAVNDRIALALAALFVDDRNRALTIHDYEIARLRLHGLQVDEAHRAVALGIEARLFRNSRRRTADVEGAHGELRSRFADGLRRNHAGSLAEFDKTPRSQITSVAHHANAALRLACEHGANLHSLDTSCLNRAGQIFRDLMVHIDHDLTLVVLDFLKRHAAHDAVAQRLDNFARFDDSGDENSVHGAAVVFADDHVLRNVNQTPRQIPRVGRLQGRIGQTLASAVRRDEVFE